MQVCKDLWDRFMDQNNFDIHPVSRNLAGEWPHPGEAMIDLSEGFDNPKIVPRQTEFIEIPDEWLLPVVRNDLPPKPNQKIQRYQLSEQGFLANRDRLEKGYRYKKNTFEQYANCIIVNARHYMKTVARRAKKAQENASNSQ